ncbi:MAG: hypothetical protein M0R03_19835 [Novosphingobium sp.]|nr:hypothetical protein [Novosphingobium sp.]
MNNVGELLTLLYENSLSCKGGNCPFKEKCWRFVKEVSNEYNYKIDPPYKEQSGCNMFMEIRKKSEGRI